jgi:SAM-dependent methyltransferase
MQRLIVPAELNQNAPDVQAMGTPAFTGRRLLDHMARRIGRTSLESLDVLDFGCGTRFTETIVNLEIPIGSYVGIDTQPHVVRFLQEHVRDPRLSFHHFNAHNALYNPSGFVMTEDTPLPVGDARFDVICMFSVITHQVPEDAQRIFKILRRYVKPEGFLFFTADVRDDFDVYTEEYPEAPTQLSAYPLELLARLLRIGGWHVRSLEPRTVDGLPMMESLLCVPI